LERPNDKEKCARICRLLGEKIPDDFKQNVIPKLLLDNPGLYELFLQASTYIPKSSQASYSTICAEVKKLPLRTAQAELLKTLNNPNVGADSAQDIWEENPGLKENYAWSNTDNTFLNITDADRINLLCLAAKKGVGCIVYEMWVPDKVIAGADQQKIKMINRVLSTEYTKTTDAIVMFLKSDPTLSALFLKANRTETNQAIRAVCTIVKSFQLRKAQAALLKALKNFDMVKAENIWTKHSELKDSYNWNSQTNNLLGITDTDRRELLYLAATNCTVDLITKDMWNVKAIIAGTAQEQIQIIKRLLSTGHAGIINELAEKKCLAGYVYYNSDKPQAIQDILSTRIPSAISFLHTSGHLYLING